MEFYNFMARDIYGEEVNMDKYRGKVVLVVNTASKCGLTPQFEELEELYKELKEDGLEILGFPCNQFGNQDPGTNKEVIEFCQLNYGVTFTMFEKVDVNGDNAHPLFNYLTSETKGLLGKKIKWNFTKFLIDPEGNVIKRYAPTVVPLDLKEDIVKLLNSKQ